MMRSKKSTTQKATFSLLSSKEKAGRDCPTLLLLKQIVRQFQLEPLLHTADEHELKKTVCEQPIDLQAVVITTPLIMTYP